MALGALHLVPGSFLGQPYRRDVYVPLKTKERREGPAQVARARQLPSKSQLNGGKASDAFGGRRRPLGR